WQANPPGRNRSRRRPVPSVGRRRTSRRIAGRYSPSPGESRDLSRSYLCVHLAGRCAERICARLILVEMNDGPVRFTEDVDETLAPERLDEGNKALLEARPPKALMQPGCPGYRHIGIGELVGRELVRMTVEDEVRLVEHSTHYRTSHPSRQQPVVSAAPDRPVTAQCSIG